MRRSQRNKILWHQIGFFPRFYGFCPNEAAWRAYFTKIGKPGEPYPKAVACTSTVKSTVSSDVEFIVTISAGHTPQDIADMLVHEAMHIWVDACESVGETRAGDEGGAYAMQAIASQLWTDYEATRGPIFRRKS